MLAFPAGDGRNRFPFKGLLRRLSMSLAPSTHTHAHMLLSSDSFFYIYNFNYTKERLFKKRKKKKQFRLLLCVVLGGPKVKRGGEHRLNQPQSMARSENPFIPCDLSLHLPLQKIIFNNESGGRDTQWRRE